MADIRGSKARGVARERARARNHFSRRLFGVVVRLFVYYLIYLSVWKCPPGNHALPDDAPALCEPLHRAFHPLSPYVGPVYEQHVEPYVKRLAPLKEKAQPLVDQTYNGFYSYIWPHVDMLSSKVRRASEPYTNAIRASYENNVEPYNKIFWQQYDERVVPIMSKASAGFYQAHTQYVVPAYHRVCEYAEKTHANLHEKLGPHAATAYNAVREHANQHFGRASAWFRAAILPKFSSFYGDKIGPEIRRIRDKVLARQDTQACDYSVDSPDADESASSLTKSTAGGADSGAGTGSSNLSTMPEPAAESATASLAADAESAKPEAAPGAAEEVAAKIMNQETTIGTRPLNMEQWKELVEKTTREAFATFLDDSEQEKDKLTEDIKPEFTNLLRKLQETASNASKSLSVLVDRIPDDPSIDTVSIQNEFRDRAEAIRVGAMAVRIKAENFAHAVEESIEVLRRNTVEILDEFADLTLQEMGRKMVSMDAVDPSSSLSETPSWKDWKEFRNVKERLVESRQEIIDHQVQMSDVNKMLREAQQTANILAQEGARMLSGLRGKADFLMQERLRKENERVFEEQDEAQFRVPDAEYFEELEDEEVSTIHVRETRTITRTYTQTHTDGGTVGASPVDEQQTDDNDDHDEYDDDESHL